MRRSWLNCPKCGHQIDSTGARAKMYYGDPHSTCPKCGAPFLNTWVIELAYYPKEWYVEHHRKIWFFLPLTLIAFIPAIVMFLWFDAITKYINPGIIMLVSFALWVAFIIIYLSKTTRISVNETGFDKAYKESEERLSNPAYKQSLENSGYFKEMIRHICQ